MDMENTTVRKSENLRNLPATLSYTDNEFGRRALSLLDANKVPFASFLVEGSAFSDPTLRVGDDEIRGLSSIEENISAIVAVTR